MTNIFFIFLPLLLLALCQIGNAKKNSFLLFLFSVRFFTNIIWTVSNSTVQICWKKCNRFGMLRFFCMNATAHFRMEFLTLALWTATKTGEKLGKLLFCSNNFNKIIKIFVFSEFFFLNLVTKIDFPEGVNNQNWAKFKIRAWNCIVNWLRCFAANAFLTKPYRRTALPNVFTKPYLPSSV